MVEDAGRKPGFLELAVAEAERADPAQIGSRGLERKLADLGAGLFGAIEPLGSASDFISGKGHSCVRGGGKSTC